MFPVFTNKKLHKSIKQKQRFFTENNEKSFHIQRQTFDHNYFKKNRPTEILFSQSKKKLNAKLDQRFVKYKSLRKNSLKHSTINLVQENMKFKKSTFQHSINMNLSQINQSFNRYISEKSDQQCTFKNQRKKILSCKNILRQLRQIQSKKNFNLPSMNFNQKNLIQMTPEINYQIFSLESNCYDSPFPYERYGPAVASYQNQLILYGGFGLGKKHVSCFHKYDIHEKLWKKVQENSVVLSMIPAFHTIDIYKNYMILAGGMFSKTQNQKRKFNSEICIFNFDKKEWIKLRSTLAVRSHASTLFGNTLLIHGGIDQKQSNSNMMHFVNFNANSIQSSIILSTENKCVSGGLRNNLSHHKLVNTNQVQANAKALLKYDGVFCFGGINQEGQMHNKLTFLNCIGKENALDVRFQSWITVQAVGKGLRPQPRKNHSLNIINKRALIVLIGGQSSIEQTLSDIWIFDLIKLQWKQINSISKSFSQMAIDTNFTEISKFQEGISGHCSTFIGTRLFIFGGKMAIQSKKENCLRYIQTDMVNNLTKKLKFEKSISPSINTIKQSTKPESMWNIQF